MTEIESYIPLTLMNRLLEQSGEPVSGETHEQTETINIPESFTGADFVKQFSFSYAAELAGTNLDTGNPTTHRQAINRLEDLKPRLREAQATVVSEFLTEERELIEAGIVSTVELIKLLRENNQFMYLNPDLEKHSIEKIEQTFRFMLLPDMLVGTQDGLPRYRHDTARLFLNLMSPTADAVAMSRNEERIINAEDYKEVYTLYAKLRDTFSLAAGGKFYGQPELHGRTVAQAKIFGIDINAPDDKVIQQVKNVAFVPFAMGPQEETVVEPLL